MNTQKKFTVFLVWGIDKEEEVGFESDDFNVAKGFIINITRYFEPFDMVCGDMRDRHGRYAIKDANGGIVYLSRWYVIPN